MALNGPSYGGFGPVPMYEYMLGCIQIIENEGFSCVVSGASRREL